MNNLVEMKNICKSFGSVSAINDVSFNLKKKEVVGLLGDNGAGKSTLIKILCGVIKADSGVIIYNGKKLNISSPREARQMGIETVHQDLSLVDQMTIARNLFLGKEPVKKIGPFSFLDKEMINNETGNVIGEVGIKVRSPDEFVSVLSGGERQAIAIGRAVHFGAKLLILDEPLRALSIKEQRNVLNHIRQVKDGGSSVIFITHNVYHVYSVADRFVLLNKGEKLGELKREEVTPEEISEIIATGKMK